MTNPDQLGTAALTHAAPEVYWTDRDRPDPRPAMRDGSARADLVVVGGGFTGLWAAIAAKERDPGREVVVLDRGRLGVGASGRNGGFVSPSLTHGLAQGVAQWPDELEALERLGTENFAGLVADVSRFGIDADFHQPGEITMALGDGQVDAVREGYELHVEHGVPVRYLDETGARARVDSPRYRAGMFDPLVGLVDPARLVWGLADAAESLGVVIAENTAVLAIESNAAGLRVRTGAGAIDTPAVILATGPARGLLARLTAYVLPVYDHVLMTEPLTAAQLATIGWEGREGITDAGNQFHYYRRTLDDRILFGGYDATYHFGGRIDPKYEQGPSHQRLATHFFEIFPQLEGLRFTHRWAGVIDTTSRFTPVFGTAKGGRMAYAVGYTGLGVGASRFGARVALDLLDGHETEATSLRMVTHKPLPFPPEPLRSAGVALTRRALAAEDRTGRRGAWLRGLDRLGIGFDS